MRRALLFTAVVIVAGILGMQPSVAQENRDSGLRLSVVGLGVKHDDYQASLNFYTKVMGFRAAFSFSPNGKTTNTYLQLSRDTFLEMGEAGANAAAGLTHIHLGTDNVDAVVARIRQAGGAACTETLKTSCIIDTRIVQPTNEKAATIVDPDGIRFEPSEFVPGSLTRKALDSWNAAPESRNSGLRVMVVGIAVKDYPESQKFYEKVMGFPVAFKFSRPDGKRTTTYYQISRDSFLEMQSATADVAPGITHVHLQTNDLTATIARLREAGLATGARNATTPNTVTEAGMTQPSNVKSANVFDPSGVRLELNELIPESLTKKAMDSWK